MNGGYPPPGMGMPPMGMPQMGMPPPMNMGMPPNMPPMPMGVARPGLGMRPPGPAYGVGAGQGPSMMALASQRQQQQAANAAASRPGEGITLFVGSIAEGITDAWMEKLLGCCGLLLSFKRLITPANKPQGFGFATFDSAEAAARAVKLLDGVELPGMEGSAVSKKLHVRADEANKARMEATLSARMSTDSDEAVMAKAKADVAELVGTIRKERGDDGSEGNKERYVVPPHLHDLQEADLPETQRGLVISEIALFRERSAKRERERERATSAASTAPGGPKKREWGKPQEASSPVQQGFGRGAQGYNKPVGFVKEERADQGRMPKTDFELEEERKEARRKDEEMSFRDRERRYEPREKQRINALERQLARQRAIKEAEERDAVEMKSRLHVWDDDESDEYFYTDRERWRSQRARRLLKEEAEDIKSRKYEEEEAEHLRRESEAFLARQMEDMQALADEQRKAGMLLDDGAPVRLNMSLQAAAAAGQEPSAKAAAAAMFAAQEEEEELKKRKAPLVKLDFSAADGEKAKEQLEKIRKSVAKEEKEALFKSKVRWDGITDRMIDGKFEPLVKRQMVKYLGELEDDDLVMFSIEHLKDHKGPQKLVEGLEPVLEEDAVDLVVAIWRQVIFESMAYSEGLSTERIMVE